MRWVGRKILGKDPDAPPSQIAEPRDVLLVQKDVVERLAPARRVMEAADIELLEREPALDEPQRLLRAREEKNRPLAIHLRAEVGRQRFGHGDDAAARPLRQTEEAEGRAIGIGAERIGNDREKRGFKRPAPAVRDLPVNQAVVDAREEKGHFKG